MNTHILYVTPITSMWTNVDHITQSLWGRKNRKLGASLAIDEEMLS